MAKILKIDETADPNQMRLVIDEPLPVSSVRSFQNGDEAVGDPYAGPLFNIMGLRAVEYDSESFLLTKESDSIWRLILAPASNIINARIATVGKSAELEKNAKERGRQNAVRFELMKPEERLSLIQQIFSKILQPRFEKKGTHVEAVTLKFKLLTVRYQGKEDQRDEVLKEMTQLLRTEVSPLLTVTLLTTV